MIPIQFCNIAHLFPNLQTNIRIKIFRPNLSGVDARSSSFNTAVAREITEIDRSGQHFRRIRAQIFIPQEKGRSIAKWVPQMPPDSPW